MAVVFNESRSVKLGDRVEVAATFLARARGLMFRKNLPAGGGLVLNPCNSIHMFFMYFSIDVLFLDEAKTVVAMCRAIKPWRVSWIYWKARMAVELPAGVIEATGTEVGDSIAIREGEDGVGN